MAEEFVGYILCSISIFDTIRTSDSIVMIFALNFSGASRRSRIVWFSRNCSNVVLRGVCKFQQDGKRDSKRMCEERDYPRATSLTKSIWKKSQINTTQSGLPKIEIQKKDGARSLIWVLIHTRIVRISSHVHIYIQKYKNNTHTYTHIRAHIKLHWRDAFVQASIDNIITI